MGRGRAGAEEDFENLLEMAGEPWVGRFEGVRWMLAGAAGEFDGDRWSWRFVWLWLRPAIDDVRCRVEGLLWMVGDPADQVLRSWCFRSIGVWLGVDNRLSGVELLRAR